MTKLYLGLSFLGTVLPALLFAPWLLEHGLALHLLARAALATPVSAFAWADVLVSGLVLLVFMAREQRRLRVPRVWLPVLGLFAVGVSLAFPLYLALRESAAVRTSR